jgi:hypothetical protein
MNVTVQDGVGTARFTNNPVTATIERGAGVVVQLDAGRAVVTATFRNHGGAVRLTRILPNDYNCALSDDDKETLLSAL